MSAPLTFRDGRAFLEGCAVDDLADRHGTPFHAVSEEALRRAARRFHEAFAAAWPEGEVVVLPAVKANYVVAVQRVLAQEGCGADVFGAPELEVAVRAGTDPDRISLNGPSKDLALLRRAVALGARITLDAAREVEVAREAARLEGRPANVRLRLRPRVTLERESDFDGLPMRETYARYKAGMPWDDVLAARDALLSDELDLSGVMMHFGRQSADLDTIGHVVDRYAALVGELSRAFGGWTPRTVDVGGGFAQQGDPYGKAAPDADRGREAPPVEAYAAVVCERLRAGLAAEGIPAAGIRLELEPGRSLFGPCGVHVTRVLHVKREEARTWVETDTSVAFLPDVVLEHARHPVVPARANGGQPSTVDVVGRSCEFDVLAEAEALAPVAAGDVLAFCLTGAYHDSGSHNFNALPRPATLLVTGGEAHVVRRAETVDDVLRRDRLPPHLRG